jgi:FolB domain-containing protein
MARDQIVIEKLELWANLGVPDAERATPQRLLATLVLEPLRGVHDLRDDVARTIDYAVVAKAVQELAKAKPRRLLETLVEEVAAFLLTRYPLAAVEVEIRKYILPDAEAVLVRLRREGRAR